MKPLPRYSTLVFSLLVFLLNACWSAPSQYEENQLFTPAKFGAKTSHIGLDKADIRAELEQLSLHVDKLTKTLDRIALPPAQTDLVKVFLLGCLNARSRSANRKPETNARLSRLGCHPEMMTAIVDLLSALPDDKKTRIRRALELTDSIYRSRQQLRERIKSLPDAIRAYRVFLAEQRTQLRRYRREELPDWSVVTNRRLVRLQKLAKAHQLMIENLGEQIQSLESVYKKAEERGNQQITDAIRHITNLPPSYRGFQSL